jgi:hypothetical protein
MQIRSSALVALVVAAAALPAQASAAVTVVVPSNPSVFGGRHGLPVAYALLHAAGLRVSFPARIAVNTLWDCWPDIVRQSPRAGARVKAGTVVTLDAAPPMCLLGSPGYRDVTVAVPDFSGRTVGEATGWAQQSGLIWQADLAPLVAGGAPALLDNYPVTRQTPAPGSVLQPGVVQSAPDGQSGFLVTSLHVYSGSTAHVLVHPPRVYVHRSGAGARVAVYVRLDRSVPRGGGTPPVRIVVTRPGHQRAAPVSAVDATPASLRYRACYSHSFAAAPRALRGARAGDRVVVAVYVHGVPRPLRAVVRLRSHEPGAPDALGARTALGCV